MLLCDVFEKKMSKKSLHAWDVCNYLKHALVFGVHVQKYLKCTRSEREAKNVLSKSPAKFTKCIFYSHSSSKLF